MKLANNLSFESVLESYQTLYDCEYSDFQKKQLEFGYEDSLDISQYANPAFNYMQMNFIRNGLVKNLDISKYAFVEYDQHLMEVIYRLLESGTEFDRYVDGGRLDIDKLIDDYAMLCKHNSFMQLDSWAAHSIYKGAPYYTSYK